MSRSIYKGPYVNSSLLRKIKKMQALNTDFTKTAIKTWARSSVVIPSFVGKIFEVHNGIKFNKVYIIENMIGHKLGEFSPTRVFARHNHDKYKSNNKNRKIIKKKK